MKFSRFDQAAVKFLQAERVGVKNVGFKYTGRRWPGKENFVAAYLQTAKFVGYLGKFDGFVVED